MGSVNPNRAGLVLAAILAGWHLLWAGLAFGVIWNRLHR